MLTLMKVNKLHTCSKTFHLLCGTGVITTNLPITGPTKVIGQMKALSLGTLSDYLL